MSPRGSSEPQSSEYGVEWPTCPECGGDLVLFDRWLWCPEHGAFSPELERIELDEEKMALIESSLRARDLCIDFMSKLKPKLEEEKRFLFLKAPPWSVNVMEGRGGSIYMYASKAGASMTRPAIWGIPMAFFLMVTWNSGIVAKDDFKTLQKLIFDQYGTLENAANLVIVFAPGITEEAASYCAKQKTCLRLAQQALNQIGFIVIGPSGEIISEVSGRLRGYVKHHFPEAYELLFKMRI